MSWVWLLAVPVCRCLELVCLVGSAISLCVVDPALSAVALVLPESKVVLQMMRCCYPSLPNWWRIVVSVLCGVDPVLSADALVSLSQRAGVSEIHCKYLPLAKWSRCLVVVLPVLVGACVCICI